MAEAGLQVLNDSGILQIDSTYSNYRVIASGVTSTGAQYPGFAAEGWNYTVINVNRPNSILAIKCSVYFIVLNSRDSAGNIAHTVLTKGAASFSYWAYDDSHPDDYHYGMEVYNAAGVRVFSAAERYLKVLGFYNEAVIMSQPDRSISSPGFNPAFVHCNYSAMLNTTAIQIPGQPPQYGSILQACAAITQSGGAVWGPKTLNSASIPRGTTDNMRFCFMLVDVNNF